MPSLQAATEDWRQRHQTEPDKVRIHPCQNPSPKHPSARSPDRMEGPIRQMRRSSGRCFRPTGLLHQQTPGTIAPRRETLDQPVSLQSPATALVLLFPLCWCQIICRARTMLPRQFSPLRSADGDLPQAVSRRHHPSHHHPHSLAPTPSFHQKGRVGIRDPVLDSPALGLKQQHSLPLRQPLVRIQLTTPTWPLPRRSSAAAPGGALCGDRTARHAPRATCPTCATPALWICCGRIHRKKGDLPSLTPGPRTGV